MIPKTIHYCWFGGNPLPPLAKKCIKSWKKYCPDYDIIEWNESNYDIASAPLYVRQAYEAKKWAFVTDYVRLQIIYENGGIYFDTDVEVIKSFDSLLKHKAFFGFEDKYIATGLGFGAEKKTFILKELMDQYSNISLFLSNNEIDNTPCPVRNTEVFINHGLKQNSKTQILDNGICIYASDYFCPKSFIDGIIRKTENTYSIHHFDASWLSEEGQQDMHDRWERKQKRAKQKARRAKLKSIFIKLFGEKIYKKLRNVEEE